MSKSPFRWLSVAGFALLAWASCQKVDNAGTSATPGDEDGSGDDDISDEQTDDGPDPEGGAGGSGGNTGTGGNGGNAGTGGGAAGSGGAGGGQAGMGGTGAGGSGGNAGQGGRGGNAGQGGRGGNAGQGGQSGAGGSAGRGGAPGQGGSGGQSGTGGNAGSGGSGVRMDAGVDTAPPIDTRPPPDPAACCELARDWIAALPAARECDVDAPNQCVNKLPETLHCAACNTFAADTSKLKPIYDAWRAKCLDVGCPSMPCLPVVCQQPSGGRCRRTPGQARADVCENTF